ncbi:MAG TPA: leucyl aminopeptidase [Chloroflexota bacterium]|nr:leucyl aminopeptidase [Chloroflexota bacterium]
MELTVVAGRLPAAAADTIVVNLFQGVEEPGRATGAVDAALGGAISRLIGTGDFRGKLNQTAVLYPGQAAAGGDGVQATRVVVVGLGKREDFTLDRARQAAGTAARKARDLGARQVATVLHGAGVGGLPPLEAAQALAEGTALAVYRFDELKSRREEDEEDGPGQLERVQVVELDESKLHEIEAGLGRGRILAESALFARTLVTRPGNVLTPRALAREAEEMCAGAGLRCEILEPAQIAELQMGALMGVAQGSDEPARFIIVEHAPQGTAEQPPVVLCGKAITFDTGGISIKPAEGMGAMKDDMAGGAAVLGALRSLALLGVPQRTIGLIPATENMPSGKAIRPGDVLRVMDGQTIEIISTDAEGRLVLADALAYGQRYGPRAMLDIATLTGGVVTALGHGAAGVMGNDQDVIARLQAAGQATGEKVWELPLWDEEYKKIIRSDIADMKNSGGRAASPIAGGMLLKQFAKQVPWAHVDMAGMAWADADAPYIPKGATGYGVRLLAAFAASYSR